jgi:putative transcriptional regulator
MKNKVKEYRTETGMSVAELARRAKTSRQTIHAIEKGDRKNISGSLMFSIADALKRDERDIFFVDNVLQELHDWTA